MHSIFQTRSYSQNYCEPALQAHLQRPVRQLWASGITNRSLSLTCWDYDD